MNNENSVNTAITEKLEEDSNGNETPVQSSFPMAVDEVGRSLFEKYPNKTANITAENKIGIIRIKALNAYMQEHFGIRYNVLDEVADQAMDLSPSVNASGIMWFINSLHSIQATFEQHTLPEGFKNMLNRR